MYCLLYSSRKEFRNIDVFIVKDETSRIRNDGIDDVSYSKKEFEEKRKFLFKKNTVNINRKKLVYLFFQKSKAIFSSLWFFE